jgi:hypothetical protein
MKPDRYFYATAGAIFLVLTLIGFRHYIFGGTHTDGSPIDPAILAVVVLHSSAIFAWYVLFFVQSLLISAQNRKLHMKLGWSVLIIAATILCTGPVVAIRSVRLAPNESVFDWPYARFLLIMLAEIALYTVFVTIGVVNRKRPRIHRPMMLLASLVMLTGATARTPFLRAVFGDAGWFGFFGPVLCLGGVLLLLRCAMTRGVDRWFAAGYASFLVASVVASRLLLTASWMNWAGTILKL